MYLAKETLTGHAGLGKLMQTSLLEIEQKARKDKKHRFRNLYRLLNNDALMEAWRTINKKAASGVDRMTAKRFSENLEENVQGIVECLKEKRYHAKLVRRVNIPKDNGETRPLGIPAIADKLVQSGASKILESIYEQDFIDNSYGYRPNVGATDTERFYNALGKRLGKFGLELSKEKTNIISFSRFRKNEKTHFEFLGFEFRWGVSHKGKDIIMRQTSRKKLRKSVRAFKKWCKEIRNNRIRYIVNLLNSKLRGYYNYYGVIGNSKSLWKFHTIAMQILYKWLNRRSQRKSFNWIEFTKLMKWYGVLKPRIVESIS